MFPTLGIVAATIGMLVILYLIMREFGDLGTTEKRMLQSSGVLVIAVGIWQAIAQMGAAAH